VSTETDTATDRLHVGDLLTGRLGAAATTLLVGFTSGCWVAYVLVYPVSSLPLPKYTLAATLVLGVYVDYAADSMLSRIGIVLGGTLVAYVTGFVWYSLPALLGWYTNPVTQRALYLSGLRETFIFTLVAMTLLFTGTFVAYIVRNAYEEITR